MQLLAAHALGCGELKIWKGVLSLVLLSHAPLLTCGQNSLTPVASHFAHGDVSNGAWDMYYLIDVSLFCIRDRFKSIWDVSTCQNVSGALKIGPSILDIRSTVALISQLSESHRGTVLSEVDIGWKPRCTQ